MSSSQFSIAKVDCFVNVQTCAENHVASYPTRKFFAPLVDLDSAQNYFLLNNYIDQKILALENKNELVELNGDNFHNQTAVGGHLVMFYASWCGMSRAMFPFWKQLSEFLPVYRIDCHIHRSICAEFEIMVKF